MEELPIIKNEDASLLYNAYCKATDLVKKYESPYNNFDGKKAMPISEISNLELILSNSDSYINLANSLYNMRHDLIDFNKSMEETLEYTIKYIRGQFNGRTEAEIQSVTALLGLIPIATSVGQSKGKLEGDINLGVYDFEKLVNIVPSHRQWLKDFLAQYVSEVNQNLESLKKDEKEEPRLNVKIGRINNAIKDCYREENITRLKFASQNVLGGLKDFREYMFPIPSDYGEKNFEDRFLVTTREFITSLKNLKEFSADKKKISFKYNHGRCNLYNFEDESISKIKEKFFHLF